MQAERRHYDLLNIVLVCLGSKSSEKLTGILRLLNMLLLDDLSPDDKTERLEKEFGITVTPHLEKGVAEMCNLSEGIEKRGKELAKKEDVLEMLKDGLPFEKIAQYTKLSLQVIEEIAKQNKLL